MPQNKKETKEKKPKVNLTDDVLKKAEYPISNRESLQDYDALKVKRWVEEHEL